MLWLGTSATCLARSAPCSWVWFLMTCEFPKCEPILKRMRTLLVAVKTGTPSLDDNFSYQALLLSCAQVHADASMVNAQINHGQKHRLVAACL